MSRTKRTWLPDVALGVGALIFGWASLLYPFGRDQGLYYYVAREWVLRGAIPYRDVLDHKTPGIYLLYAAGVRLFGEVMWPIRAFDFLCIGAIACLAGGIVTPRGERVSAGIRGGAMLGLSVLYYGYLDYWNTAQSELWYSMLGLGAVWSALRIDREERAQLAAGAFAAAAMLMKPPAMWFIAVAVFLLVRRLLETGDDRWRRFVWGGVRFAGGSLAVLVPVLGYFAARHALLPMLDIVVGANNYYVKHETGIGSQLEIFAKIAEYGFVYAPLGLGIAAAFVFAWNRAHKADQPQERATVRVTGLLLLAGFLAVWMQKKFYLLHWTVFLGPATVALAASLRALLRTWPARKLRVTTIAIVASALLYVASTFTAGGFRMWSASTVAAVRWLRGEISRAEFSAVFASPVIGFWFDHSERLGDWLREHTTPEDTITVRGFQPEIYAVAKRRHAGRFFWTTFIVNPARAYKRAEWLAEDLRDLREHPPKYVVTLSDIKEGPDSTGYFAPLGYEVAESFGEFTILKRAASTR